MGTVATNNHVPTATRTNIQNTPNTNTHTSTHPHINTHQIEALLYLCIIIYKAHTVRYVKLESYGGFYAVWWLCYMYYLSVLNVSGSFQYSGLRWMA